MSAIRLLKALWDLVLGWLTDAAKWLRKPGSVVKVCCAVLAFGCMVSGLTAYEKEQRIRELSAQVIKVKADWKADASRLQADVDARDARLAEVAATADVGEAVTTVLTGNPSPKFAAFGGQLRLLKEALATPLNQLVNIAFLGDSITWGRTLPDNAESIPRNLNLQDPRDAFITKSFVNEFKRYVGREYFPGVAPVLSNWSAAASGEAVATYEKTVQIYPRYAPINQIAGGPSESSAEAVASGTVFERRWTLSSGNHVGTGAIGVSFTFTGDSFSLVYTQTADGSDYEVFVDGASIGVFSTSGTTVSKSKRTHTFTAVRGKVVTIRHKHPAGVTTGVTRLYLEAIEISKKVRVTNQGVIGITVRGYLDRCFGTFGPSVTSNNDEFFIVQLGTNDRALSPGISYYQSNLNAFLTLLTAAGKVVLMAANAVDNDAPPTYIFPMPGVKSTLMSVAKEKSVDFIDNLAATRGIPTTSILADGLHPNESGHAILARNIIGALEAA